MSIKKAMYDTALAEFEARRDKAITNARIYLERSAGIGEHGQFVDEFIKQITIAAEADESASMLIDTFRDELIPED